jgi:hypothetical protein
MAIARHFRLPDPMRRSTDLFVSGAASLTDISRISRLVGRDLPSLEVPAATKFDCSRPADSQNVETLGHAGL